MPQLPGPVPEPTFMAKFEGTCPACHEEIDLGDRLRWSSSDPRDRHAIHAGCTLTPEPDPAANGVCPRCFQARSVTGACGCDV